MRYLLFLLWIPLCFAQEQEKQISTERGSNKNFLWEISQANKKIYLLGSIHVGNKSLYPMNPAVMKAFDESDRVGLEVELSTKNILSMQKYIGENAFYKAGETQDYFNEQELITVGKWMRSNNMPDRVWKKMKPWMIYMNAGNIISQKAKLKNELGIDLHFSTLARKQGKEIVELETVNLQLDMFANLPELKKLLLGGCENSDETNIEEIHKMLECIKKGDDKVLEEITQEMKRETPKAYEKLITERNKGMVQKIKQWLEQDKRTFVIVGAAHLPGPEGIIELMKNESYSTKRLYE